MVIFRKIAYVSFAFIIMGSCVFAEMYKWIDDKGVVHFSDSLPAEPETISDFEKQPTCAPSPKSSNEYTQTPLHTSTFNRPNIDHHHHKKKHPEITTSNSADIKLNDGSYDQRFSSPEKTFALFKKLLLAGDLKNVTECFMPSKAEQYYNMFTKLRKADKLEEFAKNTPDNIRLESEYDPYYDYAMVAEQGGKKFSFVVKFIKIPSGIYLLYFM